MSNNTINTDKTRDILKGMTLSQKKEFFSKMMEENNRLMKIEERKTTFLQLVSEWGYKTPTDFIYESEILPNPTVTKPRTKITDEVRQNIISDLKKEVPTKEISTKYGVTEDSVYNIKGKAGLTKPKTKKVPTPTVTVPTPTVPVGPTTVPTPMDTDPLGFDFPSSVVNSTDFFASPEPQKEVA